MKNPPKTMKDRVAVDLKGHTLMGKRMVPGNNARPDCAIRLLQTSARAERSNPTLQNRVPVDAWSVTNFLKQQLLRGEC